METLNAHGNPQSRCGSFHKVQFIVDTGHDLVIKDTLKVSCCLVTKSCSDFFVTPWTVTHQDPLSKGFPREEYWSGLPFPSPGHLPDSGIKPNSFNRQILYQ